MSEQSPVNQDDPLFQEIAKLCKQSKKLVSPDQNTQNPLTTLPAKECGDLGKRLLAIYEIAIRRANEVKLKQSDINANDVSAANTHAVLTRNADLTSDRADC